MHRAVPVDDPSRATGAARPAPGWRAPAPGPRWTGAGHGGRARRRDRGSSTLPTAEERPSLARTHWAARSCLDRAPRCCHGWERAGGPRRAARRRPPRAGSLGERQLSRGLGCTVADLRTRASARRRPSRPPRVRRCSTASGPCPSAEALACRRLRSCATGVTPRHAAPGRRTRRRVRRAPQVRRVAAAREARGEPVRVRPPARHAFDVTGLEVEATGLDHRTR